MPNDEIDQFCAVVSEELRSIEEESAIRTAIQLVPRELWVRYSELARLRIEEKLIASIKGGRYQTATKKLVSGAFGTWAMGLGEFFALKSQLASTIVAKLVSSDALEQAYGVEYFGDCLPALEPDPDMFLTWGLERRLRSGDEVLYRHLQWIKRPHTPVGWKTALEKAYDEFAKADPYAQGIPDDDVPF